MNSREADPAAGANRRGSAGFSVKGCGKALSVSPQCKRAEQWV